MAKRITLNKVSKRFGGTVALDALSLDVEAGEILGLLGPNGAGKSTTLHVMTGLLRPTSGEVLLFGKELRSHFPQIAKRIGVLPERPAAYPYLTVRDNLRIQAMLARREVNLDRAMDRAGLLPWADVKAGQLSQGLAQRLGLAQAMLTDPEVLILDEPTSGLDNEGAEDILRLLRRLREEAGVTVVFSTHLIHEVDALCDRVAVLFNGRMVACETPETLLAYDMRQVEVLLEGLEGAAKRLRELDWLAGVEVKPGRLLVRLHEENAHQLNYYLVNAGYKVSGVFPRRRTLQEYFLQAFNASVEEETS